jgi:hypothetical protein
MIHLLGRRLAGIQATTSAFVPKRSEKRAFGLESASSAGALSGMNAGQAKPVEAFGGADGRETDNKLRRKEP